VTKVAARWLCTIALRLTKSKAILQTISLPQRSIQPRYAAKIGGISRAKNSMQKRDCVYKRGLCAGFAENQAHRVISAI